MSSFLPDSPKIPVSHEKHVTDVSRVTEIEKRNSREIRELCHRRFESHEKHVTEFSRDTKSTTQSFREIRKRKNHILVAVYMYLYMYMYLYLILYLILYLYLCSRKTLREEREIFKKRERESVCSRTEKICPSERFLGGIESLKPHRT